MPFYPGHLERFTHGKKYTSASCGKMKLSCNLSAKRLFNLKASLCSAGEKKTDRKEVGSPLSTRAVFKDTHCYPRQEFDLHFFSIPLAFCRGQQNAPNNHTHQGNIIPAIGD